MATEKPPDQMSTAELRAEVERLRRELANLAPAQPPPPLPPGRVGKHMGTAGEALG